MSYVTRILTQLPFGNIIGAPMKAAIEAQALAARSTLEFIQAVGFKKQNTDDQLFPNVPASNEIADAAFDEVRSVTFTYKQQNVNGADQTMTLTVPILTIVPIPFLRIEEMTIDFTAKMTEEFKNSNKTTSEFNLQTSASVGYKAFWSPVSANFNVSVSTKRNTETQSDSRFASEATMSVHVRAVQDDMPAGLAKVLTILEQAIKSNQPAAAPAPATPPAAPGG
ncbi:MAG: DUF2589 domain-containing protein [Mucilaginibacter polytrichastri]|nr:DUF2589 domain-containing protein [Mucilaginibacter polytrichastri]